MLTIIKQTTYTNDTPASSYKRLDLTKQLIGQLPLSVVKDIQPEGHGKRKHHKRNGKEYVGNYYIDDWKVFKEDVRKNGVLEPITIFVEQSGEILINEGSHRIEACLQTDTHYIPVDIRYFGGAETHVDFFDTYLSDAV
ncbi:hypothetical protein CN918_29140 [Priestia megaterium]|nr:hypothetical protein CN918_29140 [Priestia megaterium]